MSYIITTRRDGSIALSKQGHWGNMPMPSEEAAEKAARDDAKGQPLQIKRITVRT